jgi:hypothetical protein
VTYGVTFDYESQLMQVTYSNATPTSSFLYNGDNLRVKKTDSSGTTVFLYDGSTVIGEATAAGVMQVYYTPGVDYRPDNVIRRMVSGLIVIVVSCILF